LASLPFARPFEPRQSGIEDFEDPLTLRGGVDLDLANMEQVRNTRKKRQAEVSTQLILSFSLPDGGQILP
jgi:hypothetical protein